MALSSDLISQFVKATKDTEQVKNESTVYGTTVEYNGGIYVRFDGSELLTPVSTTTNMKAGERVTVMIKNHTATVTGNISSPSARTEEVQEVSTKVTEVSTEVSDKISEFEIVVADKVSTEDLDAEKARIEELRVDNAVIKDTLKASGADVDNLTAEYVVIKDKLETNLADISDLKTKKLSAEDAKAKYATVEALKATNADIDALEVDHGNFKTLTSSKLSAVEGNIAKLQTDKLDVVTADISYAKISELNAATAKITNLKSDFGDFRVATTEKLNATDASIEELQTGKLSAADIEGKYANIDFSNISEATMAAFYAKSGLIENVTIGDATISGRLVGVIISGDLIEGNTIKAEKLVIKGTDGLYYKLNTNGVTTEAEQTNYNSLNGSVITAKSITAKKISVDDLVAFDATIGGFNISESSIYSGVKSSVDNTTRGLYMDNVGQFAFGDATNFVKYYKDQNGNYRLEISADSMILSSSNKSIATAIDELSDSTQANAADIHTAQETADNAQTAVNTLETRVTTAETKILQNSEAINLRATKTEVSTAKSEAISTASADATTKANNALSSANVNTANQLKSYSTTAEMNAAIQLKADGIVSSVSSTYATKTALATTNSNVTAAQTSANNAKTAADAAQADIDNLEIGGRNLYPDSERERTSERFMDLATYIIFADFIGREVTISFDAIILEGGTSRSLMAYPYQNNGISIANYYNFTPTDEWTRFSFTTTVKDWGIQDASYTPGSIRFYDYAGENNYAIRRIKIELGNRPTDWTPAPEDMATSDELASVQSSADLVETRVATAESLIQQLSDSISMLVTDGNGESLMTQTETGWTFSTGEIQNIVDVTSENLDALTNEVGSIDSAVGILQQAVNDLGILTDYVKITTYENEPCIELGETDSDFKLLITNTRIMFMEGSSVPAYINNQSSFINKAVIEEELQQGKFVWKVRSNGNLGLIWKGGN